MLHIEDPPLDQNWLLDRIQSLDYKPNAEGICVGFSYMGLQAMLSNEFKRFYRRLQLINSIPVNEFPETIAKIKQQRIDLIKKVKEEYQKVYENEEKAALEKESMIQEQLIALKKSLDASNLSDSAREAEFSKRKEQLLYHYYMQKKINEALLTLTEDERLKFDIPLFIESLIVYQQPLSNSIHYHDYMMR